MTQMIKVGDQSIEEFFDTAIKVVETLEVELDDNPLEAGPSVINEKIAQCRRNINKCERLAIMVSSAKAKVGRLLRDLQTEYTLQYNDLYTNDPRVRAGRSEKERDAMIGTRLSDLLAEIEDYKSQQEELKQLAVLIRSAKSNLKDTNARIKDQMTMCQEDIKMGSRWGSASILDLDMIEGFQEDPDGYDRDLVRKNSVGRVYLFDQVAGKDTDTEEEDAEEESEIEDEEGTGEESEIEDGETEEKVPSTQGLEQDTQFDIEEILKTL